MSALKRPTVPSLRAKGGYAMPTINIRPRHTAGWQSYSRNQPEPMPGLPTGRHYRITRN